MLQMKGFFMGTFWSHLMDSRLSSLPPWRNVFHFAPKESPLDTKCLDKVFNYKSKRFYRRYLNFLWIYYFECHKNKIYLYKGLNRSILIKIDTVLHFVIFYTMERKLKHWILAKTLNFCLVLGSLQKPKSLGAFRGLSTKLSKGAGSEKV